MDINEVLSKYPLPWVVHSETYTDWPCIRDGDGSLVLYADWDDIKLLEFLAHFVNEKFYVAEAE